MNAPIELTLATAQYDHVRDLATGDVRVPGIELRFLDIPSVETIFHRFLNYREWDVSEFGLSKYVSMISRGDDSLVGLPVFLSRTFRHSSIYVRPDIRDPAELRGSRIGVPEWAQTAGICARAVLVHECGLALSDAEWTIAGLHDRGRPELVPVHLPDGVTIVRNEDRTLDELFRAGDLDAIVSARPPRAFFDGDGCERLYRNHVAAEREYGLRTGIVPIMHLVVIRREIVDRYPWVAGNLFQAFAEARVHSLARLGDDTSSHAPIPWLSAYLADSANLFGGEPWPYGVAANERSLTAFCRWSAEQGITPREVTIEELFPPALRTQVRV